MIEGKDYDLIVHDENAEYWACRILTGDYPETVIRFGSIALNELEDHLSFNFDVLESPDPTATADNEDLQFVATRILESVIDMALEEGSAKLTDRATGNEIKY